MATVLAKDIRQLAPNATVDIDKISQALTNHAVSYGVDSEGRLEAFLAQATHETDGFKSLREYATGAAYEGREDLGNTQPGDGVKFRGRGIFMITGRSNYKSVSQHIFGDDRLLNNPEILEQPEFATISALHFWNSRKLNDYVDKGDFKGLTKRINGGLNGWADRLSLYEKAKLYVTNSDAELFLADARNAVMRNPESSIAIGLALLSVTGFYIYKIAKSK